MSEEEVEEQHPTQLEARYLGVGSRRTFELHATSKRTVEVRGGTIGKFCLRTGRGIDNLSDWLLTRKSHTFARWCAERDGHALPSNRYGEEPLPKATKEPAPVKVDRRQLGMFGEEPR